MAVKRDRNGRFIKGSGPTKTSYSKTNPPKNPGRKPSRFKQIIGELDKVGETLSMEDYRKISLLLLTLNKVELVKIAQDKSSPMALVAIASAIAGDIENKQMTNINNMLDRIFGKATQTVQADVNSNVTASVDLSGLTTNELLMYNKLLEKVHGKKQ
ncbi:MAG TPA: hypothetical protein DDW85_02355 [Porphyromonadaceae bacterium]|nr:hypothetical protein [Porphyromonadaceae bacterium]